MGGGGAPSDAFGDAYGGGGFYGAPPPSSPGDAAVLGELLRLGGAHEHTTRLHPPVR